METVRAASNWIVSRSPNTNARVRLFCFPYAGAGASAFRAWEDQFPEAIHLCRVQLPGRDERIREKPLAHVSDLTGLLVRELEPYLDLPYAFFGHSMGALIAFELARSLRRKNCPVPSHLFLSARRAPHLPARTRPIHDLPVDEFKQELRFFAGTPEQVLENDELMQLLLPTLRADFSVCETHTYLPEVPLAIPITAFGSLGDPEVFRDELEGWRSHTASTMTLTMFPGDHFFLHPMRSQLIEIIGRELLLGASASMVAS
jgi:medium-chain acyl-[acyl-carrier-protein] hydrolase